jgi:hypothetical protein
MNDNEIPVTDQQVVSRLEAELVRAAPSTQRRIIEKFILAALGSIPWVGGFNSAAASLRTEQGGLRLNALQSEWLKEHEDKIHQLHLTLTELERRFLNLGSIIDKSLSRVADDLSRVTLFSGPRTLEIRAPPDTRWSAPY